MIVADAYRRCGVATPEDLDPKANRAITTEYLTILDETAFGA